MMKVLSRDINIIDRWCSILDKYTPVEIDSLSDGLSGEIVLVDLDSCAKEFFSFVKSKADIDIDFIVLEGVPNVEMAKVVLTLGAKAYGNTFMLPVHLNSCIQTVKEGKVWVYPEFTYTLISELHNKNKTKTFSKKFSKLTSKEMEIVLLVIKGLSNDEIANRLGKSVRTIKVHLTNIFQKLKISSRLELVVRYYEG